MQAISEVNNVKGKKLTIDLPDDFRKGKDVAKITIDTGISDLSYQHDQYFYSVPKIMKQTVFVDTSA